MSCAPRPRSAHGCRRSSGDTPPTQRRSRRAAGPGVAAGAGPATNESVTIDIDSRLCKTYGLFKRRPQGHP